MGLNEPASATGPGKVSKKSAGGGAAAGGAAGGPGGTPGAAPPRPPRPPLPPPAAPPPPNPAACTSRLACHTCTYFNCSGNMLGSDAAANASLPSMPDVWCCPCPCLL